MRRWAILVIFLLAGTALSQAQPSRMDPDTTAKKDTSCCSSSPIYSFQRLIEVLEAGGQVRAVFHYARCRLVIDGDTTQAPDAVGGMDMDNFEYFAPQSVGNEMAFVSSS